MAIDFSKPVQTRAGLPVRIICTDRLGQYPIVCLVGPREDQVIYCDKHGIACASSDFDLVYTPPKVVKTEYSNLYKDGDGGFTESLAQLLHFRCLGGAREFVSVLVRETFDDGTVKYSVKQDSELGNS